MPKYRVDGIVTLIVSTVVEADSPEQAKKFARAIFSEWKSRQEEIVKDTDINVADAWEETE